MRRFAIFLNTKLINTLIKINYSRVTIFVMFFVGRLILRELHFIYKNKQYMFLIVKTFATFSDFAIFEQYKRKFQFLTCTYLYFCISRKKKPIHSKWKCQIGLEHDLIVKTVIPIGKSWKTYNTEIKMHIENMYN
jgi:hypothetical protein